jgi:hypothetical protein
VHTGQRSWDAYNEFLQQGTLDRFTKVLARYELFKRIIDLPGDIVECGVFKGTGVLFWAKLIQVFNPLSKRKVIGFDTFAGYPETTRYDHDRRSGVEFLEDSPSPGASPEEIMETARSLQIEHRIELVQGDATVTIGEYVRSHPGFRVGLLNLDFDTYDPTAAALDHMYRLVVPNGVIAFDEYALPGWGESDAVDEFFSGRNVVYQSMSWALSPAAFLIKTGVS